MSWIALAASLGAWGFAWWRTRPETDAGRGEAGDSVHEQAAPLRALADSIVHNGNEIESLRDRLDALEARKPVDVSGLRERVERLWQREAIHMERIGSLEGALEVRAASDPFERMVLMPPRWRDLSTKYAETEGRVALYKTEHLHWPDDFTAIQQAAKAIHTDARPIHPDPLNGYVQVHVPEPVEWPETLEAEGGTLTWTGLERPAIEQRRVSGAAGTEAGDVST